MVSVQDSVVDQMSNVMNSETSPHRPTIHSCKWCEDVVFDLSELSTASRPAYKFYDRAVTTIINQRKRHDKTSAVISSFLREHRLYDQNAIDIENGIHHATKRSRAVGQQLAIDADDADRKCRDGCLLLQWAALEGRVKPGQLSNLVAGDKDLRVRLIRDSGLPGTIRAETYWRDWSMGEIDRSHEMYDMLATQPQPTWYNLLPEREGLLSVHSEQRLLEQDLASTSSLQASRDWLEHCDQRHDCHPYPHGSKLPTRVIKVTGSSSDLSVVIHVTHPDERAKYVALSYVWGPSIEVRERLENLAREAHQGRQIAASRFPDTIRDAIKATSMLGISYLWIDCLCVLQDDIKDKMTEIGRMFDTFRNAYVTLVASAASTCTAGFLYRRELPHSQRHAVKVKVRGRSGNEEIASLFRIKEEDSYPTLSDPMVQRAWCFQEHLLSTRKLIFNAWTVRRMCYKSSAESPWAWSLLSTLSEGTMNQRSGYVLLERTGLDHSIRRLKSQNSNAVEQRALLHYTWATLIAAYTVRKLTVAIDRLPGIAGLAEELLRAMRESTSGETNASKFRKQIVTRFTRKLSSSELRFRYEAGLWWELMCEQLLWAVKTENSYECVRVQGPSWSWCSVNAAISFQQAAEDVYYQSPGWRAIQIYGCESQLVDENVPLGIVIQSSLTVSARLYKVHMVFQLPQERPPIICFDKEGRHMYQEMWLDVWTEAATMVNPHSALSSLLDGDAASEATKPSQKSKLKHVYCMVVLESLDFKGYKGYGFRGWQGLILTPILDGDEERDEKRFQRIGLFQRTLNKPLTTASEADRQSIWFRDMFQRLPQQDIIIV